jgi:hypothetical protein
LAHQASYTINGWWSCPLTRPVQLLEENLDQHSALGVSSLTQKNVAKKLVDMLE